MSNETTTQVTNSQGRDFTIRIVRNGDSYGLDDCLTHDKEQPFVEFYDLTHMHTTRGQFVSRYSADTLLLMNHDTGLDLDCGVEPWSIDGATMNKVVAFISANA